MTPDPDPSAPLGLIGGIGLTEVHVYAQRRAPDGAFSGCPHVHAVTDEGYFVLQGRGSVEFHDLKVGFRTLSLELGQYVHFGPMILHRLISAGDLVILGMLGSAGVAERGEARIYFGPDADANAARFAELMALPKQLGLEGALQRRDAAVQGYQYLLNLWQQDRDRYFAELKRFFDVHSQAMAATADTLREQVRAGPIAWAAATQARINDLPERAGVPAVLLNHRGDETALGMCGILRPITRLQPLAP